MTDNTEKKPCTCPSGDGSLRWPCQEHGAPVAVPDGFLIVTPEQLERHATTAWECPPQSRVVLLSSIKRLHDKNAAAPAAPAPTPAPAPSAQEAWRIAAVEAARRLSGLLKYASGELPDEVVSFNIELCHHLIHGTPEQIGWVQERVSDPEDPELGHWLSEEPGTSWQLSEPLYTAPPAAEQPDPVKVPRELLERIDQYYQDGLSINPELEQLRALLGKEDE